jgi:hypothetical protein
VVLGFGFFLAVIRLFAAFPGNLEAGGALMNYLLLSVSWTVAAAVLGGYLTARRVRMNSRTRPRSAC